MVAYAIFTNWGIKSLAVVAALLGCAAIGFADDWLKVMRKRSLGLKGRWKLLGQIAVAAVISVVAYHQDVSTEVFVPIVDFHVDLGPAWYGLVLLMVLGATNAVNLTDGLDGLAERHHGARDAGLHGHGRGRLPGRAARGHRLPDASTGRRCCPSAGR